MNQPVTKSALATLGMDALDRDRVGKVAVSAIAGGVSFATALEVMEFAKLISTGGQAVAPHMRNNPGMCLAVTFQAIEWRMSPIAVGNKSYVVNDRLAYESQLVHAVIESRAPLSKRLECDYEGEGADRICIVTGTFLDGETREYKSPKFKDIRTKNSPLWKDDPDQQFWYYASRSWCRKWCPDVLLGIYTRDELADSPQLGREEEPAPQNIMQRLETADRSEGHKPGHVENELNNIAPAKTGEILPPVKEKAAAKPKDAPKDATTEQTTKPKRSLRGRKRTAAPEPQQEPNAEPPTEGAAAPQQAGPPTTGAEYQTHAMAWIEAEEDQGKAVARWNEEDEMRNNLNVPVRIRIALKGRLNFKFGIED